MRSIDFNKYLLISVKSLEKVVPEEPATEVSVVVKKEHPNKYHESGEESSEPEIIVDGTEEELGPPDYATDPEPILSVDPIPPQMLWEDAEHCLEEHAYIFCDVAINHY